MTKPVNSLAGIEVAVQLLIDTKTLPEDLLRSAQAGQLVSMLEREKIIAPSEVGKARRLLQQMGATGLKGMEAQGDFLTLLQRCSHRRLAQAGDSVRKAASRMGSGVYGAVSPKPVKP